MATLQSLPAEMIAHVRKYLTSASDCICVTQALNTSLIPIPSEDTLTQASEDQEEVEREEKEHWDSIPEQEDDFTLERKEDTSSESESEDGDGEDRKEDVVVEGVEEEGEDMVMMEIEDWN